MIFGGIEHYAARYLMFGGTLDVETSADQMLEVIMRGIENRERPDSTT